MSYAWFDLGDGRTVYRRVPEANHGRSILPAPMIITDTMQPVKSMLDGKIYDSKSHLRSTYKAAGVIEVGNDRPPPKQRKSDRKGIRESLLKAKAQVLS